MIQDQQFIIADSIFFDRLVQAVANEVEQRLSTKFHQNKDPPKWLTASEAAKFLRCSVSTLNRRVRDGLQYQQRGRVRLFNTQVLNQFLNK